MKRTNYLCYSHIVETSKNAKFAKLLQQIIKLVILMTTLMFLLVNEIGTKTGFRLLSVKWNKKKYIEVWKVEI